MWKKIKEKNEKGAQKKMKNKDGEGGENGKCNKSKGHKLDLCAYLSLSLSLSLSHMNEWQTDIDAFL